MKREDIAEKYKWDLSLVLKDKESFLTLLNKIKSEAQILASFENKLNCRENILAYLEKDAELDKNLGRVYLYAMLRVNSDTSDSEALSMMDMVENLSVEISKMLAFVMPELAKLDDKFLMELENDSSISKYSRIFEDIIKQKPHTLSVNEERIVAGIGAFSDFNNTFSMLDNVEIKFEDAIDKKGKAHKLTNATYGLLMRSDDAILRENAHINMHKAYSSFNLTLASNYINQIKKSDYFAKTYHFNSTFNKALFNEEVSEEVYNKLIFNVHKNLNKFFKFCKLKKEFLGKSCLTIADMYAPIEKSSSLSLSFEEAYDVVLKALSVLGEDYISVLKRARDERWIDVFPNDGKQGGAFSVSCETGNPFVLLNYNKTYNDISTIAHELGHAMHSYYSEHTQPHEKCDYVIFVAEVASTVNEVLLCKYLLNNSSDKKLKRFLISSLLEDFYATVFRQTMFSEFEFAVHSLVNTGKPITYKELNEEYNKLQQQYFGSAVKLHKYAKYEWSRIPHFYRPFYVYKYATGFICAIAIADRIEKLGETAVNDYKEFLKSGCKADPITLLKIAGVDITDDKTYEEAFNYYGQLIEELKNLK